MITIFISDTERWRRVGGVVTIASVIVLAMGCLTIDAVAMEAAVSARYALTFQATWSQTTHPTDFPPNPHFSPLIGGTHNNGVAFWEPGELASTGIKNMAETGSTFQLTQEVTSAIADGTAMSVIAGAGASSPGSAQVSFTVYQSHSLATVVTMIAPSPDWFLGVHGLPLFQNGQWVDEVIVNLQPYDAGTDSGTTYLSADAATLPPLPISLITGAPFQVGDTVPPLGTFTFKRLDPVCDLELSQVTYAIGDTVTAATVDITNPEDQEVALELKIWLASSASSPQSILNLGSDGTVTLPAHTDVTIGPVPFLPLDNSYTAGTYELNCRFIDPVTGRTIALDVNTFEIEED